MTKLDRQKAAISSAVRSSLHKMGREAIAGREFFGTNQAKPVSQKKAA